MAVVASACEHADERGFALLADTPTGEQRDRLAALLHTPTGRRLSVLERLRRLEVEPTIGGLINGLARVQELRELSDGPRRPGRVAGRAAARADGRRRSAAARRTSRR